MPKFRVPFHGSLLVEAETQRQADFAAHHWAASMKEVTVGVPMQPIPASIKASDFDIAAEQIADVTAEYRASVEKLERETPEPVKGLAEAYTPCYVGEQKYWDHYEFQRRLRTGHQEPKD